MRWIRGAEERRARCRRRPQETGRNWTMQKRYSGAHRQHPAIYLADEIDWFVVLLGGRLWHERERCPQPRRTASLSASLSPPSCPLLPLPSCAPSPCSRPMTSPDPSCSSRRPRSEAAAADGDKHAKSAARSEQAKQWWRSETIRSPHAHSSDHRVADAAASASDLQRARHQIHRLANLRPVLSLLSRFVAHLLLALFRSASPGWPNDDQSGDLRTQAGQARFPCARGQCDTRASDTAGDEACTRERLEQSREGGEQSDPSSLLTPSASLCSVLRSSAI